LEAPPEPAGIVVERFVTALLQRYPRRRWTVRKAVQQVIDSGIAAEGQAYYYIYKSKRFELRQVPNSKNRLLLLKQQARKIKDDVEVALPDLDAPKPRKEKPPTMAALCLEVLARESCPLHIDEMYDYIKQRLPDVQRRSVHSVVRACEGTKQVAPSVWGLAAWDAERLANYTPPPDPGVAILATVEKIITDLLTRSPDGEASLFEAAGLVVDALKTSYTSAYRWISKSSLFETEKYPYLNARLIRFRRRET